MATGDNDRFLRTWPEVSWNKIGIGYSSKADAQNSSDIWFPYNKVGHLENGMAI